MPGDTGFQQVEGQEVFFEQTLRQDCLEVGRTFPQGQIWPVAHVFYVAVFLLIALSF